MLNIIPIILQLHLNLSSFTIGIGVINNLAEETASALFHLGYDKDDGFSLDLFFSSGVDG
jgi:hypothetical protein